MLLYCIIINRQKHYIKVIIYIAFILLTGSLPLNGQDEVKHIIADSVQILDQVNEAKKVTLETEHELGLSLLNSVENQSFSTIRSGGPSVISTVLNRGMASRHIAVLWGGFNVQSVVNGTFDLSLVQHTFDNTNMYGNGTSIATGNASMAGALSLSNTVFQENATHVHMAVNSTQNLNLAFLNKLKVNSYSHHLAFSYVDHKNQYNYKSNGIQLTQEDAAFSMWDLNYEGAYILSDKLSLRGGGWLQNAERSIPPTKTSVQIKQEQKDANYRGFLQLAYYPNIQSNIKLKSAFFNESIDYQAPGISSKSIADVYNVSLDYVHTAGLTLRSQYRNDRVNATFFEPTHIRNTFGIMADYSTQIKSTELGISIRPEWVDNTIQPLVLGVRLAQEISSSLTTTFRYHKGYTLPSFNDLYWPQGGNPELLTERSHEFELGLKHEDASHSNRSTKFNLFFSEIDDWIQWTPIEGFFQPVNQRKVRNMGFEVELRDKFKVGNKGELSLVVLYSFTDSRLARHYLNPDNEGKRAIFIPAHKLTGEMSFSISSFKFKMSPLFYSKRYDTVDNSTSVPGFFVLDIHLLKRIPIKDKEINLSISMENALNNDYENIRFYPMPLRIVRFGAHFKL